MEFKDAIIITGLGMAVVFSGLLLTAGLILAFGRLQSLIDGAQTRAKTGSSTTTESPKGADPVAGSPIDPEVLTIIATVLEIEHRLHRVVGSPSKRAEPS